MGADEVTFNANCVEHVIIRAEGSGMGLPRGGQSRCSLPMISNMAEPIGMKLSGFVEGRGQSNLAKEFFKNLKDIKVEHFGSPVVLSWH